MDEFCNKFGQRSRRSQSLKVDSCSPTQHSITKSRVSLAHTTSLGNSSTGGEKMIEGR